MGVGELGGDIELEVFVIWNNRVSQFDNQASLLSECLQNTYKDATWSINTAASTFCVLLQILNYFYIEQALINLTN